jgi:ADP-ribose pyrophosphatase YjhB (NUDIX family)
MPLKDKFVIRVYGIITNAENEVLISDEYVLYTHMTKFPGGGLEFGEGPEECIVREIREECQGQEITNIQHFYTTGFYQKALFYENAQLISIYYTAKLAKPVRFKISKKPFDFNEMKNGNQSFRWVKIQKLKPEQLSFPIDKFVAEKLLLAHTK